jgi:hypothetical protein
MGNGSLPAGYATTKLAYPDIISDMINYPDIRITHYPDMISA